jgi:hypothetical protein
MDPTTERKLMSDLTDYLGKIKALNEEVYELDTQNKKILARMFEIDLEIQKLKLERELNKK